MKKYLFLVITFSLLHCMQAGGTVITKEPDSAYLFAYASLKNGGRNGLHFAWSIDRNNWHAIGPEHSYVRCDYGTWGAQKRMLTPFLYHGPDDMWHAVWSVNETDGVVAHAASKDLVYWQRQSYPILMPEDNCLMPTISFDTINSQFMIMWQRIKGEEADYFRSSTADFKHFSVAERLDRPLAEYRKSIRIDHVEETGTTHKVPWTLIKGLMKAQQHAAYEQTLWSEKTAEDVSRFASLKPLDVKVTIDVANNKKISDLLMGVFFEDINYAADGGLYAELVQNRDFEYRLSDKKGADTSWNSYKAWTLKGQDDGFKVDSLDPLHPNNPHYAVLKIKKVGTALINEGFDGIPITAGDRYDFSVFAKADQRRFGGFLIRLSDRDGVPLGETRIDNIGSEWTKYEASILAKKGASDACLEIIPQKVGQVHLDMISLFPEKTFKGRKNGLRADLAQAIADIHPRFVRFPGGCVAHGDGLANMYRWQNTIGPLEARVPQRNLWNYHQTAGLGYFEYFQFCEDIGAEPVPVVPAGVPCQNSSVGGAGQQGGIPLEEMDSYIQEVLNLIEYANGDVSTVWGKKRADAGHPKPFNLKYIGIGNEDLITDVFEERFTMIFNKVREKHPEITVIGTVGPSFEGTDYTEGWHIADKLQVPMIDEHYYQSPGWFIHNQEYYDKYDRTKAKVYLGEYAAHLPGRPNNLETALAEALYLTSLERNGDVVSMASYAPLLAKENHTQWNPDLIYFNNTEIKPTVGYYVQQLYGQHAGDTYLPTGVELSEKDAAVGKRFAISVVRDSKSGDVIVKMVNLLPVTARVTLDLGQLGDLDTEAIKTVLTGSPEDRKARPKSNRVMAHKDFNDELSAYSFTVFRFKTRQI
ncbi:alpha-L-arabinofuranosidase C-terminal domain-containing protein [Olivibacter sp. XZL3]|uniref:alpha-L-arabinofuranosidase C-terminal domain-containing protein n=1 Tax=Olivibacter sp. XZL3 TaxID=1735116 RepID=UPI0010651993|nr:alpha-L-arabinofuranosidase C-terminal domain-containing protein [Olivibacter sp. XZL3]